MLVPADRAIFTRMIGSMVWRLLSLVRPVRTAQLQGKFGPLEVRWERGRKVLNAEHSNQSFGSLHGVLQGAFEHMGLQHALPESVLLLGLGGGSAVHILRRELGIDTPITAVEIDPAMVELAISEFGLEEHRDVHVVLGDAIIQIQVMRQRFALVVVDLFADLDLAQGVDTAGFAHALRDRCAENGVVCFNTVSYDKASEARCTKVKERLMRVFSTVEEFRTEELNRVFIAR